MLGIYSSLTNTSLEDAVQKFVKKFSEFKEIMTEILVEKIEPISNEIKKLTKEKEFLDDILLNGIIKLMILFQLK